MQRLFDDIRYLKGIGPKRTQQFNKLGIENIFDLFWTIPRAYLDRSNPDKIKTIKSGQNASIRGRVMSVSGARSRRGMHILKALIQDETGIVTAVWFNQSFLIDILKRGQDLFVSGKVKYSRGGNEINVSEYELLDNGTENIKIMPAYSLTEGLSQKTMRNVIKNTIENYLQLYPEILDQHIKQEYDLCDIAYAFYNIHFPGGREEYLRARRRLALEELILFQASLRQEQGQCVTDSYVVHKDQTLLASDLLNDLPFSLTAAQQRVVNEIYRDMESPRHMNRLLQGDVGAGKTVIAALAMAKAVASGYQAAIMAPTEILAEQHYISINRFFKRHDITIALLTGSTNAADRRLILTALQQGQINILIGTHALIQDDVLFHRLGLAVIDEQHRFGVKQRALLGLKGKMPDVLVMTATPIPRTLALTLYGELSVSVVDELPPGRKPVKTIFVKNSIRKRVYEFIRSEINSNGTQAYIVCPLVEDSEKQDLQAAVSLYEELRTEVYTEYNVGLVHGRMKPVEKDYVMARFKQGQIKILVSTTVIEVGVDVPQATIMVVVHAERFGLSQLHQLRGRVGRSDQQSYCFLIGDPRTEDSLKRLKIMENTNDGFKLAQYDLVLRGPGEFWGIKQHGADQLKIASLVKDQKLIQLSQLIMEKMNLHNDEIIKEYIEKKFKKSKSIANN